MKMEGDAGEMQPEAQEAGRGKEGTPPTPPGALRGTAARWILASSPPNCQRVNYCHFKSDKICLHHSAST